MNFKGKTALVTGGSRGIGRAIALEMASQGANIVVNYTSNEALAAAVVGECEAFGVKAVAVKADVSCSADVEMLTEQAAALTGQIDFLINNAGITKDTLLIRMKEEDWDDVLQINLKGAFLLTKLVGKAMLKKKAGRIVNITSVVGVMGNAGQANYAASKAGLIGLTKSAAKEFASRGITVNAVAPGFIRTDMTDALSEEVKAKYAEAIPLGDMGEAQDVARTVAFFCSEGARYITGQVLLVDGGLHI